MPSTSELPRATYRPPHPFASLLPRLESGESVVIDRPPYTCPDCGLRSVSRAEAMPNGYLNWSCTTPGCRGSTAVHLGTPGSGTFAIPEVAAPAFVGRIDAMLSRDTGVSSETVETLRVAREEILSLHEQLDHANRIVNHYGGYHPVGDRESEIAESIAEVAPKDRTPEQQAIAELLAIIDAGRGRLFVAEEAARAARLARTRAEAETDRWRTAHAEAESRIALLRGDPALPIERLDAFNQFSRRLDAQQKQVEGYRDHARLLAHELSRVCDERDVAYAHAAGNFWYWQGDGEDRLESLTVPVLIRPGDLMEILGRLLLLEQECRVAWDYIGSSALADTEEDDGSRERAERVMRLASKAYHALRSDREQAPSSRALAPYYRLLATLETCRAEADAAREMLRPDDVWHTLMPKLSDDAVNAYIAAKERRNKHLDASEPGEEFHPRTVAIELRLLGDAAGLYLLPTDVSGPNWGTRIAGADVSGTDVVAAGRVVLDAAGLMAVADAALAHVRLAVGGGRAGA